MIRCDDTPGRSETGAILVLALIFLVTVGVVVAALVTLAGTNLVNTTNLQNQRSLEFSADAAVDGAIQTLRGQSPTSSVTCPTPLGAPVSVNGVALAVECTMAIPPGSYGRIVEFDACAQGLSFSQCQSAAVVRANVTYDDLSSSSCIGIGNPSGCTYGSTWGTGLTVWSWVVDPGSS